MEESVKFAVIVKVMGRTVGYKALYNRILTLWHPTGDIKVVDLDNHYYLVRLNREPDYKRALLEGPWTMMGNYIVVQPCRPDFNPEEEKIKSILAWIRFSGLPYHYYHRSVLILLAGVVGHFKKVDYNTEEAQRGRFARVAVELDLEKPLVSHILIDGRKQGV